SVGSMHMRFWGSTLSTNLPAALELYADILRRPHLPAEEMDAVRALAYQDIQSLEDEPRQKVLIELRRRHLPPPLGQDRRGTVEGIESLTIDAIREQYQRFFRPAGTILSVAGNIDWEPLVRQVERLFGDWKGAATTELPLGQAPAESGH